MEFIANNKGNVTDAVGGKIDGFVVHIVDHSTNELIETLLAGGNTIEGLVLICLSANQEQRIWSYINTVPKKHFNITTITLPSLIGPQLSHSQEMCDTNSMMFQFIDNYSFVSRESIADSPTSFIDIRDAASVIVESLSLSLTSVCDQRLTLKGSANSLNIIELFINTARLLLPEYANRLSIIQQHYRTKRLTMLPYQLPTLRLSEAISKDLQITYTPFDITVVDTFKYLFAFADYHRTHIVIH